MDFGAWEPAAKVTSDGEGEWVIAHRASAYRQPSRRALLHRYREPVTGSDRDHFAVAWDESQVATRVPTGVFQELIDLGLDPVPWFALELIEAVPLRCLLENGTKLDVAQATSLALLLCDAVAALHAAEDRHGNPLQLLAKRLGADTVWLTKNGTLHAANPVVCRIRSVRTPGVRRSVGEAYDFLAPEQLQGLNADVESDLFSIGLTLLSLLLGRSPLLRSDAFATLHAVRDVDLRLVDFEPAPAALRAVLMRALERDPKKRPPSVRELSVQLSYAMRADGVAAVGLEGIMSGFSHQPLGM